MICSSIRFYRGYLCVNTLVKGELIFIIGTLVCDLTVVESVS